MKRHLSLLLFSLTLVTSSVSAQPFGGGGWHEHRKEFREELQKKLDALDLTPEQRDKLKALREKRDAMHDQHQELRDERKALWESMQDRSITDEQLMERFRALNTKEQSMREERFKGFLERRAILTPEQFAQMAAFWKEKRDAMTKGDKPDRNDGRDDE